MSVPAKLAREVEEKKKDNWPLLEQTLICIYDNENWEKELTCVKYFPEGCRTFIDRSKMRCRNSHVESTANILIRVKTHFVPAAFLQRHVILLVHKPSSGSVEMGIAVRSLIT